MINSLIGKPMTKKEKIFLEQLRQRYKKGELSVMECHKIWDKEILKINRPDWWYKEE
jgi:hypothetical protein